MKKEPRKWTLKVSCCLHLQLQVSYPKHTVYSIHINIIKYQKQDLAISPRSSSSSLNLVTNSTSCNAVKTVLNRDQHVLLTTLVWLHLLRAGFRMARYAGLWLKSSTLGSPSHLERFVEFGLGCLEPFRNRTEVSQSFFFCYFLFGKTVLNSNLDRVRQLFFLR